MNVLTSADTFYALPSVVVFDSTFRDNFCVILCIHELVMCTLKNIPSITDLKGETLTLTLTYISVEFMHHMLIFGLINLCNLNSSPIISQSGLGFVMNSWLLQKFVVWLWKQKFCFDPFRYFLWIAFIFLWFEYSV